MSVYIVYVWCPLCKILSIYTCESESIFAYLAELRKHRNNIARCGYKNNKYIKKLYYCAEMWLLLKPIAEIYNMLTFVRCCIDTYIIIDKQMSSIKISKKTCLFRTDFCICLLIILANFIRDLDRNISREEAILIAFNRAKQKYRRCDFTITRV